MEITPFVDRLREDLARSAAATDEQTRAAAERLASALDPAVRLTLMEALSQATSEITTEMREGSVEVRLVGRDLDFVVDQDLPVPPSAPAPPAPPPPPAVDDDVDGGTARITLRLPESVKTRAEELAAGSGQSLNTWIVQALRRATSDTGLHIDVDLPEVPFLDGFPGSRRARGQRRMTGWT
ncbi:HicB family protein [Nocardioides scoriae]|uniref:HicB family protein n=1 Tax=Nocardioides scoriae TaxID=642780 RepID=A0A1H1WD32_9ACTN|nr:toxin-antitoxin system HicB family antitoxin [Nocardioides scoriae]SDS95033.1 HicB family protein [Nocardioides scoriae]